MEQKFIIVDNQHDVQTWLDKGWRILSVTAQHVSTGSSQWMSGKFAIVLER
jgi:hypothetical protein